MSSVLFLFLAHLGVGIAASLALVGAGAGIKFFRFNAGLAAVLLLSALAFRPDAEADPALASVSLLPLLVSVGALLVYWASIGRGLAALRPALLWITIIGGLVAIVGQGLGVAVGSMAPSPTLTVISFVTSAALLGGACTAMILGHWYLVLPSMDVALLKSIVKFHIGSTVVRALVVGVVLWVAFTTWQAPSGAGYEQYAFSLEGVFLWQRVLFGLGSPALLSYLTWETAKINSTQSATGILYVDFFTVVVGEVLAKYLLRSPPACRCEASSMRLTLICPNCGHRLPVDASDAPAAITCGGCRAELPLSVTDHLRTDETVDRCPVCEGGDFYVRKDFDPKLGVAVMVVVALISAGFYWYGLDLIAYGVLGVAALVDLVVYGRLKDLTVCYRCHAEFRGTYTLTAPFFDLATADELELEWSREVEKRWPEQEGRSEAAGKGDGVTPR